MLDSAPRKRVMPMALLRACARLACSVRAVTVRHSSPRRIRSASALPRSNHCTVGCHITVMEKNNRRIPAIDAPAMELLCRAVDLRSRPVWVNSPVRGRESDKCPLHSSSGTLRTKPSRVRPKLGKALQREQAPTSAKLWSLVTRRGISILWSTKQHPGAPSYGPRTCDQLYCSVRRNRELGANSIAGVLRRPRRATAAGCRRLAPRNGDQ